MLDHINKPEDWLIAFCDAVEILACREQDAGPVGKQILQSARTSLERTLRAYLTHGHER